MLKNNHNLVSAYGFATADQRKQHDRSSYDTLARGINAPMYRYYAARIREKTGITAGRCVDVGSHGGYLGLELARITELYMTFLDISAPALATARKNIADDGLAGRADTLEADVHRIPLAENSVELVISRGSIPFWDNIPMALQEIHRILAPGGQAYVGVGRGTPEVKAQIAALAKNQRGADANRCFRGPAKKRTLKKFIEILKDAGLRRFQLEQGEAGRWIHLWK